MLQRAVPGARAGSVGAPAEHDIMRPLLSTAGLVASLVVLTAAATAHPRVFVRPALSNAQYGMVVCRSARGFF